MKELRELLDERVLGEALENEKILEKDLQRILRILRCEDEGHGLREDQKRIDSLDRALQKLRQIQKRSEDSLERTKELAGDDREKLTPKGQQLKQERLTRKLRQAREDTEQLRKAIERLNRELDQARQRDARNDSRRQQDNPRGDRQQGGRQQSSPQGENQEQPQERPGQMNREQAEQLLDALAEEEREAIRAQAQREKARRAPAPAGKDW